jgi:hypothetical protein
MEVLLAHFESADLGTDIYENQHQNYPAHVHLNISET